MTTANHIAIATSVQIIAVRFSQNHVALVYTTNKTKVPETPTMSVKTPPQAICLVFFLLHGQTVSLFS